jgi:hypothetical protein
VANPIQYQVTINGDSNLLMHQDNITFGEQVKAWSKDPANKGNSVAGDDRTPPWTWIGYLYHNTREVGMPSDNLMTTLREGGAKIIKRGKESYKKQTQSGIVIDQDQWTLLIDGKKVPMEPIKKLIGEMDFLKHIEVAESLGFELFVKRAVIGRAKHVRVRPMFRRWQLVGSLTVLDEELSGINHDILDMIFNQSGKMCGLGDWRPSSGSSGTYGRFTALIE